MAGAPPLTNYLQQEERELLALRARAHLSAAFADRAGALHPWSASDWTIVAEALCIAYSLYCQAAVKGSLGRPSEKLKTLQPMKQFTVIADYTSPAARNDRELVRVDLIPVEAAEGKETGANQNFHKKKPSGAENKQDTESKKRKSDDGLQEPAPAFQHNFIVTGERDPSDGSDEWRLQLRLVCDKDAATEALWSFLREELDFQLTLPKPPPSLKTRDDFGRKYWTTREEALWDLRLRFSDFLRRFLGQLRRDHRHKTYDLTPMLVFFVRPRAATEPPMEHTQHVRTGLAGHFYELDSEQWKYIQNLSQQLRTFDPNVFKEHWLSFPDGMCARLYVSGCSIPADETDKIRQGYLRSHVLSQAESQVLANTTLLEIPLYLDLPIFESPRIDGPDLILCVALPKPPSPLPIKKCLDGSWAAHGRPPAGSAFEWGEAQLVTEVAQRLTRRYLMALPARRPTLLLQESVALRAVLRKAYAVARMRYPVLITGPSGSGKTTVAGAIHAASGKSVLFTFSFPPETLIEAALFGYEKGAFTGAEKTTDGILQRANQGTLVINEIDRLSTDGQGRLLEFLETGWFTRLGSTTPQHSSARIIATVNVSPRQLIESGKLRQDLFYRLTRYVLTIPPLRERREEIEPLVQHFLTGYNADRSAIGLPQISFSLEAMAVMQTHDWPGNIRQLENVVARAAAYIEGSIVTASDLDFSEGEWEDDEHV